MSDTASSVPQSEHVDTGSNQTSNKLSFVERIFIDKIFVSCVRRVPGFMRCLCPIITWLLWHIASNWRRAIILNAAHLLGPDSTTRERKALAKEVLSNFYLFICEVGEASRLTPEAMAMRVKVLDGLDQFIEVRKSQRGAILVTAHIGSFECSLAILQNFENEIHVLFARDGGGGFNELRSLARSQLRAREVPVNDGLGTWIKLRDALNRDEVVVMQGDRVIPGQTGVEMPFFDGLASLPSGPIRLAMVTGAPIIPVYSTRLPDGRLKLAVEPAIEVDANFQGPLADHPAMTTLKSSLERVIGDNPGQWIVVDPIWSDTDIEEEQL
ncbi:MAG: lysophospholipid acyltransferase family protein [Phycisphaerales bacterium]|nr:lysophospholipid acyltransferase family protein [Phycisphaerales bacterium]